MKYLIDTLTTSEKYKDQSNIPRSIRILDNEIEKSQNDFNPGKAIGQNRCRINLNNINFQKAYLLK